jgi:RNA polymerase sigma-70 factor, ECF subfamily
VEETRVAQPDVNSLLPGLAAGKPESFAALVEQLGDRLYRTARRLVDSPTDADDVVQETFAALVRGRTALNAVRDLEAYLFTTLRRAAAKSRGQKGPVTLRLDSIAELEAKETNSISTPTHKTSDREAEERVAQLHWAVQTLPDDQRDVLTLKFDGELTLAQIATVLGISPNTAASRYRYALEKLRAMLQVRNAND